MIGLFGGAFDPPHNGHVALLRAAEETFDFDRVLILVVADPGHRETEAPAEARLALARLAFPGHDVELDTHARTIDMLRARRLADPVLILGTDELEAFPTWKEPEAILEMASLAVGGRPGYDAATTFELEPVDISSTEIRRRVAAGEPIDHLVPPAVAAEIARLGLYQNL
jgi:nicotinate-nucleotide adenylyltransferase